jgi:hypothetical protein
MKEALDVAPEHRTDPRPEPIRPGWYLNETWNEREVLAVVRFDGYPPVVVYRTERTRRADDLRIATVEFARDHWVRLPDQEPGNG